MPAATTPGTGPRAGEPAPLPQAVVVVRARPARGVIAAEGDQAPRELAVEEQVAEELRARGAALWVEHPAEEREVARAAQAPEAAVAVAVGLGGELADRVG